VVVEGFSNLAGAGWVSGPLRRRIIMSAIAMGKKKLLRNYDDWVEARRRFHLSHEHVQMARELGMNPRKLGKLDNHDQEPWKAPLPQFIQHLYFKRFARERPAVVLSVEELTHQKERKQAARKEVRRQNRAEACPRPVDGA